MYTQFPPMSSQTVTFAKAFRAEQIRAAGGIRRGRPVPDRLVRLAPPGHSRQRDFAGSSARCAWGVVMGAVERGNPHAWASDNEQVGVFYSEKRRRWAHEWNVYIVVMLALLAVIAAVAAARPFSVVRMTAALSVTAGAWAFYRSDKAHTTSVRGELAWVGAGALLTAGGSWLFVASS